MDNCARIIHINGRALTEGEGFHYDHELQRFRFSENLIGGDIVLIPWADPRGCLRAFTYRVKHSIRKGEWAPLWESSQRPPGWETAT